VTAPLLLQVRRRATRAESLRFTCRHRSACVVQGLLRMPRLSPVLLFLPRPLHRHLSPRDLLT
jgi:hypothetical protein